MGVVRSDRRALERLIVNIDALDGLQGKVGWFESAKYADGTPVAYVASIHEFGYAPGGIPPRPTMRPTATQQNKTWTLAFGNGAKAIARGDFSAPQVMEAVTLLAAGDVRKTIAELQSPPLKPATIAARRRRYRNKNATGNLFKPLVDTGVMIATLTNVVETKK